MRKLFVTLIMLFAVINIMAQEPLSFKGIPIEGSVSSFCKKLTEKGFTPLSVTTNGTLFSGNFIGRKATAYVPSTKDGKNVRSVVVGFDPSGEWDTLVETYNYCKELYSCKYGVPTISGEINPARSDSNTALMGAVNDGTVVYRSKWLVTGGDIYLLIEKYGFYEGIVVIYYDSQSIEAKIQSDLDDI